MIDEWLKNQPRASWVRPRAASVGFLRCDTPLSSDDLCKKLISEKSTLLVPGECFGVAGHVRLGFGNDTRTLNEGLSRLSETLDRF